MLIMCFIGIIGKVFLVSIRIELGCRWLCHSQWEQIVEHNVRQHRRQVLVVLEDGGKLLHDPLVHLVALIHIAKLSLGNKWTFLQAESSQWWVVGLQFVLTLLAYRHLFWIQVKEGDGLKASAGQVDGRLCVVIAQIQFTILIIQEFTPAVTGARQHIVETLVVLYQIVVDMLALEAIRAWIRILIHIHQRLHVFDVDFDGITSVFRCIFKSLL